MHGFDGDVRPAAVRYAPTEKARAEELASEVGAESVAPLETPVPAGSNVLEVRPGAPSMRAELIGETAGDPVRVVITGSPGEPTRRYALP